MFRRRSHVRQRSEPQQGRQEKIVERFVLMLSDLQLISAAALLIACFVQCEVSTPTQAIVASSAWFSCTTHLATLAFLDRYLLEHQRLRDVRILFMIFIGVGALVSQWFRPLSLVYDHQWVNVYCLLSMPHKNTSTWYDWTRLATLTVLLVKGYLRQLTALYGRDYLRNVSNSNTLTSCLAGRLLGLKRRPKPVMPNISFGSIFQVVREAQSAVAGSFWHSIDQMTLLFSFGVTQLSVYYAYTIREEQYSAVANQKPDSEVWEFGQLMPLMLLILPVLTLCEIVAGKCILNG